MQIIQLEFNLFKVTMKIIVLLCSIFLCANSFAYSPNLQEIDPAETGNDFVDTKSIKKLGGGYVQAVVYSNDDNGYSLCRPDCNVIYKSKIITYVLHCKNKSIATKSGEFYKGRTSNSDFLQGFNFINSRDGETGKTTTSLKNLEFHSFKEMQSWGVDDFNAFEMTGYYRQLHKAACK